MADAPLLSAEQFNALAKRYDTLDDNQRSLVDAEAERWKAQVGEPKAAVEEPVPEAYIWPGYDGPIEPVEVDLYEEPAERTDTHPVGKLLWAVGSGTKNTAEMASHSIWKTGSGVIRGGSGLFWRTLGVVSRASTLGFKTPVSEFFKKQAEIAETPWLTDQLIDIHRDEQIADLLADGNITAAIGNKLSTTGWDVAPHLGLTKGITGMMLAGQAARSGKLAAFISRLGLWKFVSTPGTIGERSKTSLLAMAYASTPAVSSLAPSDTRAVLADILTNHLITRRTGQIDEAIDAGIQKAIDSGHPEYAYQYAVLNILPLVGTDVAFSLSTRSARYRSDGMKVLESFKKGEPDAKPQWEPEEATPTRPINDPATTDGYLDDHQYRAIKSIALKKGSKIVDSPIKASKSNLPPPQLSPEATREFIKGLVNGEKLGINLSKFTRTDPQVIELMVEALRSPEMREQFEAHRKSGKTFEDFVIEGNIELGEWRDKDFQSIIRKVHTAEGWTKRSRAVAAAARNMWQRLGERIFELEGKAEFTAEDGRELADTREMFSKTFEAIMGLAGESGRLLKSFDVDVQGEALSAKDYYALRMHQPTKARTTFGQVMTFMMRSAWLSNIKNRTIDVIGGYLLGALQKIDDVNAFALPGGISTTEMKARHYAGRHAAKMAQVNSVKQITSALQGFKSNLFYGAALGIKEGAQGTTGGIQGVERAPAIPISRQALNDTLVGQGINMTARALDRFFPLVKQFTDGKLAAADMLARIEEDRGPIADEIWNVIDQLGGVLYTFGYGPMTVADPYHERVGYEIEATGLATREALRRVELGFMSENQVPRFVEDIMTALRLKRYQSVKDDDIRQLLVNKEEFVDLLNHIDERANARARERTAKSDFEGPDHSWVTHGWAHGEKFLRDHQLVAGMTGLVFTHSYASLQRSAMQRLPLLGMLSKELRMQSKSSDPVERRRAFAKQLTGAEIMAVFLGLNAMGLLQGDKRTEEQIAAREAGYQRNSLVFRDGKQLSFERLQPIDVFAKAATFPNELLDFYEQGLFGRSANDPSGEFDDKGRELTIRESLWKKNTFAGFVALVNHTMRMEDPYLREQMMSSMTMTLGNLAFNAPTMKSAQKVMDILKLSPYGTERKMREIASSITSGLLPLSGLMQMFRYAGEDATMYQLLDLADTFDAYTLTGRQAQAYWHARWDGKSHEEALEARNSIDPKLVPYVNVVGEVQEREPIDTWQEQVLDVFGMRTSYQSREPWAQFALKYGVPLQKLRPSFQYQTSLDPSYTVDLSPEEFYELQISMSTELNAKDKLNRLAMLLDIDDTRNLPEDHPLYELSKRGLPISNAEKVRIFKEQVASLQNVARNRMKQKVAKKYNISEVMREHARDRLAIDKQP